MTVVSRKQFVFIFRSKYCFPAMTVGDQPTASNLKTGRHCEAATKCENEEIFCPAEAIS